MAYVEIRKGGRLVKRRVVDDAKARKGCRIRMGSAGQVVVALGESKKVGKYEFSVFEGLPSDDAYKAVEGLREVTGSFPSMSQAATADFPGAASGQSTTNASPVPVIEGYRVTDRLGEGGMGTVWRAVQLSTKREVAMKFLGRHRFASKKSRARFEREVALAAKLTHPNIARVYHSGLHRNVYYYAMELIEGVHLDTFVRQNELSQREVLELMRDICDAVQHAHEQGIVHRDLKPSNILITKDGQPHVVDFGLAKASVEEEEDLTISIEGEVAGTLAYMSPEQAAGRLNKISERTDVYSLGVIIYELLTGRLPHELSGSRYDIIKRIVEEDVQSPRELNEAIDIDLESLILAALAKEPEDRYPSAAVLLQDLKNYLNGEALLARSLSRTYRIRKRIGKYRRRIVATLGFAGIVILALAAIYSVYIERGKRMEAQRRLDMVGGETPSASGQRERSVLGSAQRGSSADQEGPDDSLAGTTPAVPSPPKWIIYVDADATGTNDGHSWADAFVCLQDALAWAGGDVEIRVAEGIYKPDQGVDHTPGDQSATFKLKNAVSIRGGYAGVNAANPDARNVEQYVTILSGDLDADDVDVTDVNDLMTEPTRYENSYHVVNSMKTDRTAVLDGFRIVGGNANGTGPGSTNSVGGGIVVYDGSPTLVDCIFSLNSASSAANPSSGRGGGMSMGGGSPTLVNCTFSSNAAEYYGGGIMNSSGSPTLINCTFTKNWAEALGGGIHNGGNATLTNCRFSENSVGEGGGGMYNRGSAPTLTRCTFTRNSSRGSGGGIQNDTSKGTLSNCIFTGNSAIDGGAVCNRYNVSPEFRNCLFIKNPCLEYGGGMYNFAGSKPTLVNCTFSGNTISNGGGAGLANSRKSSALLVNCIMWGDRPEEILLMDSTLAVTYSNIQYTDQGPWPGIGNLNRDPLFVDRRAGDYHLRPGSPCINVGDPNHATEAGETDIGGGPRVIGGRVDMGAHEFSP